MTINDYYDIPDVAQPSTLVRMAARQMHRQKYAKSGLNSRQLLEYKHRLEQIMRSNKLFLWSDLTLPKLAKAVDCSVNHLSQVINSGFDMSFFDYVNEYRIQYAKDLLCGYDGQCTAILNIASTVGFNSNSAFFAAFKKHVGKTPAQYRRTQLDQPH
jgi:AraC-like DNA-binding protein